MTSPGRWQCDLPGDVNVRRVLVLKWSAMGDVVIATAACEDIHRALPGRTVHLNTLPPWRALFAADRRFEAILTIDVRGPRRGVRAAWDWVRRIRAERYDAIIDLQSNDHTRVLLSALRLSGAAPRHIVGYHRRFPYTAAPPPPAPPVHAATYARAALASAGIEARTPRPVLALAPEDEARAAALAARHGLVRDRYAVLLPGCQAAGYLKRWGAERYADLASRLVGPEIEKVVLLGGPDETEECEAIARQCGPWLVNLCGETHLLDVAALSEGARCIVGNDTGTAHIASVTTRPMTVICGPTDPARVRPMGDNVRALQADLDCINCYRQTCSHHSCMRMITTEQVLASIAGRPAAGAAQSSGGDFAARASGSR